MNASIAWRGANLAYAIGYWTALATTALGVIYALVLVGAMLTGQLTFPPTGALQLFGGVSSL